MKVAIVVSFLLCIGFCSIGQPLQTYISIKDSVPKYANIVAVLLKGKESSFADNAPVLAEYIWGPGGGEWLLASSTPWDRQNISEGGVKVDVSYWFPLPMVKVDRVVVKQ